MLTAVVFVPLAGALLVLFLPAAKRGLLRATALSTSIVPLLLLLAMWPAFDSGRAGMQFETFAPWIPSIGASYHLGIDGISYPLLLLTALVSVLAVVASWRIEHRTKEFFVWMLLLQTAMFGVFASLDYLLFFVFWELQLIPMYFIIGIWGGPRREAAALKFLLYTMAGSAFMLISILALYIWTGAQTFDILAIAEQFPVNTAAGTLGRALAFVGFFLGFGVKVPIFPFHTWLPDAHVEAPTGGSMILAGVLLKAGAYGFFRILLPTFPETAAAFALLFATLGAIGIVYGAFVAMGQRDFKRLVAYSSVSHMGFVILGLAAMTPMALNGALFVMISHGLISPLFFFLVGSVFYERTHTRMIGEMNGLYNRIPVAAVLLVFTAFANLGLPGLSGFVGEFFTVVGAFPIWQVASVLAVASLVVTAGYHLLVLKQVLMGEAPSEAHGGHAYGDITRRELVVGVPLVALVALLGVAPIVLFHFFNGPVTQLVARLGGI